MSEQQDQEQTAKNKSEKKSGNGKRKRAAKIIFVILVAASVSGFALWVRARTHIKTDDAFVDSHIYSVSARISGHVTSIPVSDNQFVKKGELLVELDPSDYRTRVMNISAQLDIAKNETSSEYAQVEAAKAALDSDQARLEQAELDLKRGQALYAKQVIPKEQLDRLETSRKVAASKLKETEGSVRRAMALLGLTGPGAREARIAQRQAELEQAKLNLSYTKIVAPADGYITRKSVEPGNNIQPGQALMALVSLEDPWITANYKESQLTNVHPGQKVEITVDTYPGRVFRGVVDSIMAGTGAAFSLLPPENATGNYVKVVQRIPVKIRIDKTSDPRHLLRVGMSAEPTILTGQKFTDFLKGLNPFQ